MRNRTVSILSIGIISLLLLNTGAVIGQARDQDIVTSSSEEDYRLIFPKGNMSHVENNRTLIKNVLSKLGFNDTVNKVKVSGGSNYKKIKGFSENPVYLRLGERLRLLSETVEGNRTILHIEPNRQYDGYGSTFLFSLNRTRYEQSLEPGTINPNLREALRDEGYPVEDDAELYKENGRWFISHEGDKLFYIWGNNDRLKVCEYEAPKDNQEATLKFTNGTLTFTRNNTTRIFDVADKNKVHVYWIDSEYHIETTRNFKPRDSTGIHYENEVGSKIRVEYEFGHFFTFDIYNLSEEDRKDIGNGNMTEKSLSLAEKIGEENRLKSTVSEHEDSPPIHRYSVSLKNGELYKDHNTSSNEIFRFSFNSEKVITGITINRWYDLGIDRTEFKDKIEEGVKHALLSVYNVTVDELETLSANIRAVKPLDVVKHKSLACPYWTLPEENQFAGGLLIENFSDYDLNAPVLEIDYVLSERTIKNDRPRSVEEETKLVENKYGDISGTLYIQNGTLVAYEIGQVMSDSGGPDNGALKFLDEQTWLPVTIISLTAIVGVIALLNREKYD